MKVSAFVICKLFIIKSFKIYNHLYLYQFINKDSNSMLTVCLHCFSLLILCIKIKNHSKCAEYVHCNHLCVSVLWESLNHIHNKLKFNLSVAEKELTQILVRVACLYKTLKYIKDKVIKKTLCLACKLADNNDDVSKDKNNSNSLNLLFLTFWDDLISTASSSQTVEAFLYS